jgi:hypothetical protein
LQTFKDNIKTVGVARQQLHFLCSDKENEAKENSGAALDMYTPALSVINSSLRIVMSAADLQHYLDGAHALWAPVPA